MTEQEHKARLSELLQGKTTAEQRAEARELIAQVAIDFAEQSLQTQWDAVSEEPSIEGYHRLTQTLHELDDLEEQLQQPMLTPQQIPERQEAMDFRREWLIKGWLPANTLTLFTGQGGIGKSYLTLQVVAALTMGLKDCYLDPLSDSQEFETLEGGPINVVYASYEDEPIESAQRLCQIQGMLQWPDYQLIREKLTFVDMKLHGPIWGVSEEKHVSTRGHMLPTGDALLQICKEAGAHLLVLDPLAGAFGGNENDRTAAREFAAYMSGWAQENECAILSIAHPPKTKGVDYSGSTDWEGSCRSMWSLKIEEDTIGTRNGEKERRYTLTNVKRNYAAPQEDIYLQKSKVSDGWSPVWLKCKKEEAIEFFKNYCTIDYKEEDHDNTTITPEDY